MCEKSKHLHYSFKGGLYVCEDYATAKIKHKLIHKVVEYYDLNPCKMINLDLISQNKPSHVGSNNYILIQDSDTKPK